MPEEKIIHTINYIPSNLSVFLDTFVKYLSQKTIVSQGSMASFMEIGPRTENSTIIRLAPTRAKFKITLDLSEKENKTDVKFLVQKGKIFLGLFKGKIKPYIIDSINRAYYDDKERNESTKVSNSLDEKGNYCYKCGKLLALNSVFCNSCGTKQPNVE